MNGITKEDLQNLRAEIPHGGMKKIAEKLGCTQDWVYRVFQGNGGDASRPSVQRVIVAALEEIERVKQEQKEQERNLKNRIKNLTTNGEETPITRPQHANKGSRHQATAEAV